MKKHPLLFIFPTLVFLPTLAQAALTAEYYTYGGHDLIVDAFNKAALIFGGNEYQALATTFAIVSFFALIVRAALNLMFGGFKGEGNSILTQAFVPWLLSVVLFLGGIAPKGTLHIYDPTENKYQAIGGIPDIMVLAAAASSLMERALVSQVDLVGDPMSFSKQAGGKGFMGLYSVSVVPQTAQNTSLDSSLREYVKNCVLFEASLTPGYIHEIRRTTSNLVDSLAKATHSSNFTTLYTDTDDAIGETVSCKYAWDNIQGRMAQPDALNNNMLRACTEMGFKPDDAVQLMECQNRMTAVVNAKVVPGKTSMDFLRSMYLTQQIDNVLSRDQAGEAMANMGILNKASATMNTVNNWLPWIRALILAITIFLTPFLSLLILTPYLGKVCTYIFGSFFFLTVWGTIDAMLYQWIVEYADKLYAEIRQYGMGLDALRLFPGSTEKILAMFGLARASSMVLALGVASKVIGLTSVVASSGGSKVMGEVTQKGAQGEEAALDPSQKAAMQRANQSAVIPDTLINSGHSWNQRLAGAYSQEAGNLRQQLGAIEGASGMQSYLNMREGQGVATSYRGKGDVALNQAVMQQAERMGIPGEQAQQIAAANVNPGEALAELRRLQAQGYSGQQAAAVYWQGKTVDHMQGKSVGQQQDFTMYRPVQGQETGKWGQVAATWQDGAMVGLQGNTVNVASTEQLRASYDKAYSQAISESYRADQSLGQSVTRSWGNSATWSQTTSAAQQLYQATNGSVDYMKAVSSTMTNSFRNSQIVDERTGQSVDKSVFAQATAGVGAQISPVKANIEGGASWRVTTSDGTSYTVNQSAEEARSMATNVGETHRTTLSTVRSGQYSETAQKALSQMESVQGTKTASENSTISYSRANEMREAQGQAHSRAADVSANLSRDFYHYVGEKQFGGGTDGDREAIKHLEGLAASGQTKELDALKAQYLSDRNINVDSLGANLAQVKGPDLSKAPDPEAMRAKIDAGSTELKSELASQPNLKATNLTAQVAAQLKTEAGAVDPEQVKAEIAGNQKAITEGKTGIQKKGAEIKQTPTERLHSAAAAAGSKSGEMTLQAAETWNNSTPGKIINGLADAVPKIASGLADSTPKIMKGLDTLQEVSAPAQAESHPNPEPSPVPSRFVAPENSMQINEFVYVQQPQMHTQEIDKNEVPVAEIRQPVLQNDVQLAQITQPAPQNEVPPDAKMKQPVRQSETSKNLAAEVTGAQPQVAPPHPAVTPGIERTPGQAQQNPERSASHIPKGDLR